MLDHFSEQPLLPQELAKVICHKISNILPIELRVMCLLGCDLGLNILADFINGGLCEP
jgi:hypothetical protein